jgi:nucleotidyltransferase substrate binding protein (TIGR01987 family)
MDDVRYVQRFENFDKSFLLLKGALAINNPSIVEKAGCIQFFETTFELAWKLMKDYLGFLGYDVKSPRDAIKQSFSMGLIAEGGRWLDALMDRNLTVHTYDEDIANAVYQKIKNDYFLLLEALHNKFRDIICSDSQMMS